MTTHHRTSPPSSPAAGRLVRGAPDGEGWLHEIKFDGHRMHARIERGVRLLTRTGLNWTDKYASIAEALAWLDVRYVATPVRSGTLALSAA
jgi:ATP-dependent DNA ligase